MNVHILFSFDQVESHLEDVPDMGQIVTERLFMRLYRGGEYHLMRSLIADPRVTFWRSHPMGEEELLAIFEEKTALAESGLGCWAVFLTSHVARDGTPVFAGQVILQPLEGTDEIEIGWHFVPEHWGHGYAREAASALVAHAWGELGLERLCAVVLPENPRSLGVIHRLGMKEGPGRIHAGRPHRYFVIERPKQDAGHEADPASMRAAGE